jgi:hypothetical protein
MNELELRNFIGATLIPRRSIAQEISVFNAVIDFIVQSITTGIPSWTNALTFNTNGTGDGTFTTAIDTNGALRFWKTKVDNNINNQPPTSPDIDEDDYWIEVSPSSGSAIKEWASGIYGDGLVIVYFDLNGDGTDPALYLLANATRPYLSASLATEFAAGDWLKISGSVPDATITLKGIMKLYTGVGTNTDGTMTQAAIKTALDLKLDAASYNNRYKGKYTTLAALQSAFPTANAGDYAQVDTGSGSAVKNYNYDVEDGWVIGAPGSGASNTDGLPEGTTNLYFTVARAIAAIPDASNSVKGIVQLDTDANIQSNTNAGRVVTSGNLAAWWTWIKTQAHTFAAKIIFTLAPRFSSMTASKFMAVDASKDLIDAPYQPENPANKDATGGYAGLTLFKINFKNALNTFTSFFTNANTAARTYTFQDRNGTIADDTDLALKANIANTAPTAVSTSGTVTINGVSCTMLTLDCAGKEDSKFHYDGNASPLGIVFANMPVGAYAMLTIERSTSANVLVRFQDRAELLSNTQIINKGKDALAVRGATSGRTVATLAFHRATFTGAQDNQASPVTTNAIVQVKLGEDTELV